MLANICGHICTCIYGHPKLSKHIHVCCLSILDYIISQDTAGDSIVFDLENAACRNPIHVSKPLWCTESQITARMETFLSRPAVKLHQEWHSGWISHLLLWSRSCFFSVLSPLLVHLASDCPRLRSTLYWCKRWDLCELPRHITSRLHQSKDPAGSENYVGSILWSSPCHSAYSLQLHVLQSHHVCLFLQRDGDWWVGPQCLQLLTPLHTNFKSVTAQQEIEERIQTPTPFPSGAS